MRVFAGFRFLPARNRNPSCQRGSDSCQPHPIWPHRSTLASPLPCTHTHTHTPCPHTGEGSRADTPHGLQVSRACRAIRGRRVPWALRALTGPQALRAKTARMVPTVATEGMVPLGVMGAMVLPPPSLLCVWVWVRARLRACVGVCVSVRACLCACVRVRRRVCGPMVVIVRHSRRVNGAAPLPPSPLLCVCVCARARVRWSLPWVCGCMCELPCHCTPLPRERHVTRPHALPVLRDDC